MSKEDNGLLERFMKEFFPFSEFRKAGIFTKEMNGDYEAQAKRICDMLGLETIYEYRKDEMRAHISYATGKRPKDEPFVTVIPSIYD